MERQAGSTRKRAQEDENADGHQKKDDPARQAVDGAVHGGGRGALKTGRWWGP